MIVFEDKSENSLFVVEMFWLLNGLHWVFVSCGTKIHKHESLISWRPKSILYTGIKYHNFKVGRLSFCTD